MDWRSFWWISGVWYDAAAVKVCIVLQVIKCCLCKVSYLFALHECDKIGSNVGRLASAVVSQFKLICVVCFLGLSECVLVQVDYSRCVALVELSRKRLSACLDLAEYG